jgi:hypothetical protein
MADRGTQGGVYAQKVASLLYNEVISMALSTTEEFRDALGRVIEDSVIGLEHSDAYVAPVSDPAGVYSVLGGTVEGYGALTAHVNANATEGNQITDVLSEDGIANLKDPSVRANANPEGGITWDVAALISAAETLARVNGDTGLVKNTPVNKYLHVLIQLDTTAHTGVGTDPWYQVPPQETDFGG